MNEVDKAGDQTEHTVQLGSTTLLHAGRYTLMVEASARGEVTVKAMFVDSLPDARPITIIRLVEPRTD